MDLTDNFLDVYDMSLNKDGEELCGDQVKTLRTKDRTIIVLSDGLGSGVKANILSTLTANIIQTMVRSYVPLEEVIETVIETLPICSVRKIAYATFTILEVDHATGHYQVVNFDNPLSFFFRKGRFCELKTKSEVILSREIFFSSGRLERGDFLGVASDGIMYAGLGLEMNFGWGRENISRFIEGQFIQNGKSSQEIVRAVVDQAKRLYRGKIGDDATFVGVYVRRRNPLMVFTGPPLKQDDDEKYVNQLLDFRGRTLVCGGTTSNIVANYLGVMVETDISSMRPDVPPIGTLPGVDLVTEGIFTMSQALEMLRSCGGNLTRLPKDHNGAAMMAEEFLRADSIHFVVGQSINEWYQNPLLPRSISIRRQLVEEIAAYLTSIKKEVTLEFC